MYTAWVRIEDKLPWIELQGTYETRKEAKEAAEHFLNHVQVRIVTVTSKPRQMRTAPMMETR